MALSPADWDLVKLAAAKSWLGLTNTDATRDDNLQRLITAVSAWIIGELNLPPREDGSPASPFSDAVTERYDGTGGDTLVLRRCPVSAVSAVSVDGRAISAAASTTANGFDADTVAIYLRGDRFTRGRRNVEVAYEAGWPDDGPVAAQLEGLALEVVGLAWKQRDHADIASRTLGTETIAYVQKALPDRSRRMLDGLRMRGAA